MQLAYEEAKRAIDRQSNSLDALRSRAGILLAAISLTTSFFGGLALRADSISAAAVVFVVVAILAALVAGGFCVAVLWPRAAWAFNLSAGRIVQQLEAAAPREAEAYKELALRLQPRPGGRKPARSRCRLLAACRRNASHVSAGEPVNVQSDQWATRLTMAWSHHGFWLGGCVSTASSTRRPSRPSRRSFTARTPRRSSGDVRGDDAELAETLRLEPVELDA